MHHTHGRKAGHDSNSPYTFSVPKLAAEQKTDARQHQCRRQPSIKRSDKPQRHQLITPYRHTQRYHKRHNNPTTSVEKAHQAIGVAFLRNPTLVLMKHPAENHIVERREHRNRPQQHQHKPARHLHPAVYPDTQNVDAGNCPHNSGHNHQRFPANTKSHYRAIISCHPAPSHNKRGNARISQYKYTNFVQLAGRYL